MHTVHTQWKQCLWQRLTSRAVACSTVQCLQRLVHLKSTKLPPTAAADRQAVTIAWSRAFLPVMRSAAHRRLSINPIEPLVLGQILSAVELARKARIAANRAYLASITGQDPAAAFPSRKGSPSPPAKSSPAGFQEEVQLPRGAEPVALQLPADHALVLKAARRLADAAAAQEAKAQVQSLGTSLSQQLPFSMQWSKLRPLRRRGSWACCPLDRTQRTQSLQHLVQHLECLHGPQQAADRWTSRS